MTHNDLRDLVRDEFGIVSGNLDAAGGARIAVHTVTRYRRLSAVLAARGLRVSDNTGKFPQLVTVRQPDGGDASAPREVL